MPTQAPANYPASRSSGSGVALQYSPYKGATTVPLVVANWGAIPVALAGGIINGATSAELPAAAGTVTFTPDTDGTSPLDASSRIAVVQMTDPVSSRSVNVWDLGVAVAVLGTVTHGSAVVANTVLVTGYDEFKMPMTESFTVTAGTTSKAITGKKAFRYLRSVALTAAADASANTLTLTTGNVYGLPVRITRQSDILSVRMDDAVIGSTIVVGVTTDPATATTGDVRGTVDFATDPNGTRSFSALMIADLSGTVPQYGVTQA